MITVLVILILMRTTRKILTRVWTKHLWLPKKLNNFNGNGSNPDMIQSEMVLMMKPHIMKMWKIKGIYLFNIINICFILFACLYYSIKYELIRGTYNHVYLLLIYRGFLWTRLRVPSNIWLKTVHNQTLFYCQLNKIWL